MKRGKLIKYLKKYGVLMAKNKRPICDLLRMTEFIAYGSGEREEYTLIGKIFGKPIMIKKRRLEGN